MLAECVKRDRQERQRLIENKDRNGGLFAENLALRNPQKRIRATQPVESVRFLAPDWSECSVSHPATHIMGTIALVLHFFGQLCFGPRQEKFILSRTHHLKDRRPHK